MNNTSQNKRQESTTISRYIAKFTLIELLVTVSIVAILATMAAPSLREMLESNRLTALNNQLVSTLNYVRAEAVKRAYPVTMCVRNTDGSACASSGGFEKGWDGIRYQRFSSDGCWFQG